MTKNKSSIILILLIILAFVWVKYHYTPYISDDIRYHYVTNPDAAINGSHFTTERISTHDNWFQSIQVFGQYQIWRFANICMITSCCLWEKDVLNTLHTLFFGAFLFTITKLCCGQVNLKYMGLTLLSIIILIPYIDRVFFWSAGAFNYLWGATFLTSLLLLLRPHDLNVKQTLCQKMGVCILAFLCGGMHEALGLPLLVTLICWSVYRRGQKAAGSWFLITCAICCALGLAFPLSAPALYTRAASPSAAVLCDELLYSGCLFVLSCSLPLLLTAVILLQRCKWDDVRVFNLLLAVIFSLPGLIFAAKGYWGGAYFYPALGMVIFSLSALTPKINTSGKTFTCLLWASLISIAACSAVQSYRDYEQYATALEQAKTTRVVINRNYSAAIHPNWHLREALPPHMDKEGAPGISHLRGLSPFVVGYNIRPEIKLDGFESSLPDEPVAFRFNKHILVRLPQQMVLHYGGTHSSTICVKSGAHRTLRYPWDYKHRHAMLHFLLGSNHADFGMDYQDGHVYLIIDDEAEDGLSLHLYLENVKSRKIHSVTVPINESAQITPDREVV